jgi:hypothetical protein
MVLEAANLAGSQGCSMSRSVHAANITFRSGLLPALRQWLSNFLGNAGLRQTSVRIQVNQAQAMSPSAHHHRTFLSLPRDFIRRRRLRRRISNAILIPLLSGVAAYVITHPTGGAGFSLPKSAQQASLAASPNPVLLIHDSTSTSADRFAASSVPNPIISGAYKLADGTHVVTELPDIVLHDSKRDKVLHVRVFIPMSQVLTPSSCFPTAQAVRGLVARL